MATGVPLELNRPLQAAEPCVLKVVCGYVCPSAESGEASSGRRGIGDVARASMHGGGGHSMAQPTRDGQSSGSAGSKSVVQKAPAKAKAGPKQGHVQPPEQLLREGAFSSPQVPQYGAGEGAARWAGPHGGLSFIPFSVVSQMDGLLKSLLGLRIERDVWHARTLAEA